MTKAFNSLKTLTKFVLVSMIIIIIYSIAEFICSIVTGISHDVLTGCIFAFFGTEIATCGFLKIFRDKEETKC